MRRSRFRPRLPPVYACPFCRSRELERAPSRRGLTVRCKACGAQGPDLFSGPHDAMAAWNRRPSDRLNGPCRWCGDHGCTEHLEADGATWQDHCRICGARGPRMTGERPRAAPGAMRGRVFHPGRFHHEKPRRY
ncbi:MAG: Lar family restriction alleviation protein [Aeromonas veronii]